jgi:lysylphosphatidylglycerol synthetase-like protein (DUF2156 family)
MLASHGRVRDLVIELGSDAMSFLAVESAMSHWFVAEDGREACVAYVDTGPAWVAACGPIARRADRERVAVQFVEAARAQGRRACFFATEMLASGQLSRLLVGEQPIFRPAAWLDELPRHRRLREQLRRARAKGVRARRVLAADLAEASTLRSEVDLLGREWLAGRRLEPMGFLVAVEPFHFPEEHRYFIAQQEGRVVGFLSAVPIGPRRAWLIEDVFRSRDAPNGTTETLIDALMRDVSDAEYVTAGLVPLGGPVAVPLRIARWLLRPLFDFAGLQAFRERLHPHGWEAVWLVYPRGQSATRHLFDSLRAFARGSLVGFAARSLLGHPSGLPWALALPLAPWTLTLAWLLATHRTSLLGFPPLELTLWVAFDSLLFLVLVRVAMRPRRTRLIAAASIATVDAVLSVGHVAWIGAGTTLSQMSLRGVATVAPVLGAVLLAWATPRASA